MKKESQPSKADLLCTRRTFLKWAGAGTGLLLAGCGNDNKTDPASPAPPPDPGPAPAVKTNRVVAVHDSRVTIWDGTRDWYGADSFVDQARMDAMVTEGVLSLTGEGSETGAWGRILPGYSKGKKVSVKMNENNAGRGGNVIDPLPQLLKSLVRGLKAGGVDESDIWIIEPSARIDDRVAGPVKTTYPEVAFYGGFETGYSSACTRTLSDPTLRIDHGDANIEYSLLPDQLSLASYFIHLPILKAHGMAGVTLTYKNLFGLFEGLTIPKFHSYVFNTVDNPLVEIYANGNVAGKTVLILGDGIYGNWINNYSEPAPWSTAFGSDLWPKTIFLSRDPVAIDSVMYDYIQWQRQDLTEHEETYLLQAAAAQHGTREHWNNPAEKKYSVIDFVQREMNS